MTHKTNQFQQFFYLAIFLISAFAIPFLIYPSTIHALTLTPTPKVSPTPKVTGSGEASASPSATGTADLINKLKQIEVLKDKIATKVAQLRSQDKTALSGTVKSLSKDKKSLIITTKNEDKTIGFDDDMIVYKTTDDGKTESTISKLSEGDSIAVFGYNNEDKSVISAKYIYLKQSYVHFSGKIADIDKTNFTITIHGKGENLLIDIESYTKMTVFSFETGKAKVGFSKLKIGDLVSIVATPNATQKDRYSAVKLLQLPPIPVSPTPIPDTSTSSEEKAASASTTVKPTAKLKATVTPAKPSLTP